MDAEHDLHEDSSAFYRGQLDVVLAFCFRRTGDPELAADLAAEVFAAALVARHGYRAERGSARRWLLGIAANKIADTQRRGHVERRAQEQLGIPEISWSDGDLDHVLAAADDSLQEVLSELPPDQRAAVRARVLDEREYDEIARQSGVSEDAVRKRVSAGLATMRRRLAKEPR
jgi:RNA polymerase sigma factor (sigma-70 family)